MACEKIRCNIEYLLAKDETKPNGVQLLEISVISLLERNDLESISRKRYFQGSATHRIKQRIGQVLLILEPHINHVCNIIRNLLPNKTEFLYHSDYDY